MIKIPVSRASHPDLMSCIDWLELNVGKGQTFNNFEKKPRTWAYYSQSFTHNVFVFAKKEVAMWFKLTWG